MCVGLGFIFGVMRVINFAQGEFLMLGMYFTFYAVHLARPGVAPRARSSGRSPAPARRRVVFVGGFLLHRYLISRVTGSASLGAESEGHYAQLILTLGVSLILQTAG